VTRLAYRLLDVFTDRPLAGNPLAVVLDAEGLSDAAMQAIAREFNLSETVFLLPPRDPAHVARLRIFTPALELPFAGHPTVGAACLIAHLRAPDMLAQGLRLVLEEKIGPVVCDVSSSRGLLRAEFIAPRLPELGLAPDDRAGLAAALGLAAEEIGFDAHRPIVASAGLPFGFIPLASLAALNRVAPGFAALGAIFGLTHPAIFLYARETENPAHHVQVRVFVPGLGAGEDPATGSAACAFAAVAQKFEQPEEGEHVLFIEQGFAMGRPSLISLRMAVERGGLTQVAVGGASVIVGGGALTL
jgi:trans-2,3-dihydro-3-hydroxyanthranilate isomerase